MQSDPWLKAISCTLYWLLLLIRCTLYREDQTQCSALVTFECNSASYLHNHRDTSPSCNYSSLPCQRSQACANSQFSPCCSFFFTCDAFQYRWCHPILLWRCNCLQFRPIAQLQLSSLPTLLLGLSNCRWKADRCKTEYSSQIYSLLML